VQSRTRCPSVMPHKTASCTGESPEGEPLSLPRPRGAPGPGNVNRSRPTPRIDTVLTVVPKRAERANPGWRLASRREDQGARLPLRGAERYAVSDCCNRGDPDNAVDGHRQKVPTKTLGPVGNGPGDPPDTSAQCHRPPTVRALFHGDRSNHQEMTGANANHQGRHREVLALRGTICRTNDSYEARQEPATPSQIGTLCDLVPPSHRSQDRHRPRDVEQHERE